MLGIKRSVHLRFGVIGWDHFLLNFRGVPLHGQSLRWSCWRPLVVDSLCNYLMQFGPLLFECLCESLCFQIHSERNIVSPLSRKHSVSPHHLSPNMPGHHTTSHTFSCSALLSHSSVQTHTHTNSSEHSPFCCALCFLTAQSPYSVHLTSQCVSHLLPFMLYLQFSRKERMWACVPFWIQHFGFVHMKNQVFGNPHNMEF